MIYLTLLIWVIYSIIEGKREANFWHHRIKSSDYIHFKGFDRHLLFSMQRGCVLILLGLISYYILDNIYVSLFLTLMNMLTFTFLHNGSMYRERLMMSKIVTNDESKWIYKKGWWDQSTTSTAWSTKLMTPISRTIQFILGVIGYSLFPWF